MIQNPWDLGSARTLVQLGFKALATTSSGFAWSMGRADNAVSLDEALAHRAAWTGFLQAATEIADLGTFRNLGRAVSFAEVNARFTSR